eukprot:359290-Chlamydomonas_euryale.AAC.2
MVRLRLRLVQPVVATLASPPTHTQPIEACRTVCDARQTRTVCNAQLIRTVCDAQQISRYGVLRELVAAAAAVANHVGARVHTPRLLRTRVRACG